MFKGILITSKKIHTKVQVSFAWFIKFFKSKEEDLEYVT